MTETSDMMFGFVELRLQGDVVMGVRAHDIVSITNFQSLERADPEAARQVALNEKLRAAQAAGDRLSAQQYDDALTFMQRIQGRARDRADPALVGVRLRGVAEVIMVKNSYEELQEIMRNS